MKISSKSKNIQPSLTRKLYNKAQTYDGVIDLTLGDPDFDTPESIKHAAHSAIDNNRTHYSANAGDFNVRKSVVQMLKCDYNLDTAAESNVIITAGGMEALYLSLLSIIDDGDEVIIFAPYYVNYVQMVELCGGIPVIVNAYGENGFAITDKELQQYISSKTVAIIINTPNNPTGEILSEEFIETIYNISKSNNLYVVSDEVYKSLCYDNQECSSIMSYKDITEQIILIDSMSKRYSMTGWRVGYAYANESVIQAMTKLQENIIACVPMISQCAMEFAYTNTVDTEYMRREFQERRDYIYCQINELPLLSCRKPAGAFYIFVNIESTGMKSEEFADKLLESQKVAVVPGRAYGEEYDKYIRIAFTKDLSTLKMAVDRIKLFLKNSIN